MEPSPNESATYLWVAETVLRQHRRPLKARQIVSFGIDDGLFADMDISRTPEKSMQARLSIDILTKKQKSKFLRTGRGRFFLRELYEILETEEEKNSLSEYTAVRRMPSDPTENVLVIPACDYRAILDFQGISTSYSSILKAILNAKGLTYIPRTEAETNSNYKQIVTYTIIQRRNKILSFRRGRYNRAASFLRGAQCVGFGGHVTEDDTNLLTFDDRGIRANAAREISEEITLKTGRPNINPDDIEIIGILNDDSSDVGVRHVAIVMRFWPPDSDDWTRPLRGEASVTQLRWIETKKAEVDLLEFEYWTQLCLRKFFPYFLSGEPTYKIIKRAAFHGPHVLCVLGSVGSGKSVTTRRLCESAGYSQVNTGEVVASLIGLPAVPETPRAIFQERAQTFISQPGAPSKLAAAIIEEVRKLKGDRIIIDGIRQIETLEKIKDGLARQVATLFVYTPPDVAYELYAIRESIDEILTLADFMKIYNAPVESQVRVMIQDADAVIYNWFGIENYELNVAKFISTVLI